MNLDWLLGPRTWAVVRETLPWSEVDAYAIPAGCLIEADEVMASGLRRRAAIRLARSLRRAPTHPEQPTPEGRDQQEGR